MITFTGNTTTGSVVITSVSSLGGLSIGMTVTGTGIRTGSMIVSTSPGTVTLDRSATATHSTVSLSAAITPPAVNVPQFNQPLVDDQGRITPAWKYFLQTL